MYFKKNTSTIYFLFKFSIFIIFIVSLKTLNLMRETFIKGKKKKKNEVVNGLLEKHKQIFNNS